MDSIEIPPEIRSRYLERRQRDLEILQGALQRKSFDEFKRIGHQLKGNAASFGYLELADIAVAMEKAAAASNAQEAAQVLNRFLSWLRSACH
ncbi:MAG: Hpt domain-containing protein [Bdellovibrionales bacterium]